jgi:hypothetical protein
MQGTIRRFGSLLIGALSPIVFPSRMTETSISAVSSTWLGMLKTAFPTVVLMLSMLGRCVPGTGQPRPTPGPGQVVPTPPEEGPKPILEVKQIIWEDTPDEIVWQTLLDEGWENRLG